MKEFCLSSNKHLLKGQGQQLQDTICILQRLLCCRERDQKARRKEAGRGLRRLQPQSGLKATDANTRTVERDANQTPYHRKGAMPGLCLLKVHRSYKGNVDTQESS